MELYGSLTWDKILRLFLVLPEDVLSWIQEGRMLSVKTDSGLYISPLELFLFSGRGRVRPSSYSFLGAPFQSHARRTKSKWYATLKQFYSKVPLMEATCYMSPRGLQLAVDSELQRLCCGFYTYNDIVKRYRPYENFRYLYLCCRSREDREKAGKIATKLNRCYPGVVRIIGMAIVPGVDYGII